MRMTWLAVMVAVLCVGAWTVSAQTQQDQQAQQQSRSGMDSSQAGMSQHEGGAMRHPAPGLITAPNEMQIQGKVLGKYKDVDVQNDKEHRIVRVQTSEGRVVMVDLGRTGNLPKGFELNEGQWVIVTGTQGKLGNDNVLFARNFANVYNLPGGAAGSGAKLEGSDQNLQDKFGDQKESGTGGSRGTEDNSTHAQYRDYPGHVGGSGPGAGETKSDQNRDQNRD